MGKKVTIQDIADELGISRNTVSKAFNGAEGLAPATRDKIIQKAMEMDYKQFSYVRTLTGLTHSEIGMKNASYEYNGEIALLTGQFLSQSHFASLMLDTFQKEASLLGYTLNTHRVTKENIEMKTLPLTFVKQRVSAILCIEMFDYEYDRMICDLGLPVLFVDGPNKRNHPNLPADQLYMDNFSEITRFIYEMTERGYKSFGFIGDYEHCQSFLERYQAFRTALSVKDTGFDKRFLISSGTLKKMKDALLSLKQMPEVFLCANDFVAIDAIAILKEKGIRVPEDVLFCGFDDSPESRSHTPALTTIHIHTQVMAYSAIQLLMSRIKEPSLDYRYLYTQCDLAYRASTKD